MNQIDSTVSADALKNLNKGKDKSELYCDIDAETGEDCDVVDLAINPERFIFKTIYLTFILKYIYCTSFFQKDLARILTEKTGGNFNSDSAIRHFLLFAKQSIKIDQQNICFLDSLDSGVKVLGASGEPSMRKTALKLEKEKQNLA